jgi:hypothetical protein
MFNHYQPGIKMKSVDPVLAAEARENLLRLERQMVRFSPRDKNYESKRRALQDVIQELRKRSPRESITTTKY